MGRTNDEIVEHFNQETMIGEAEKAKDALLAISWTKEDIQRQFKTVFRRQPTEEELTTCVNQFREKRAILWEAYAQLGRAAILEACFLTLEKGVQRYQGRPFWASASDRIIELREPVTAVSPDLENIDKIYLYGNGQLSTTFGSAEELLNWLKKTGNTGWMMPTINQLSCLQAMKKDLGLDDLHEVWSKDTIDSVQKNIFDVEVPCKIRLTLHFSTNEVCRDDGLTFAAILLVHEKEEKNDRS